MQSRNIFNLFVGEIIIMPDERRYLHLGSFTKTYPAKGFSIEINPDKHEKSLITNILTLGTNQNYMMVLEVINKGPVEIYIAVWGMK